MELLSPAVKRMVNKELDRRDKILIADARSRIEQFKSKSDVGQSGKQWLRGRR